MKIKNANFCLGFLVVVLLSIALFISACSSKAKSPSDVVKEFVMLCEDGKMDEAQKLLASKNNVDYFKKFKHMGKDMIFIDYDYKGNDDVISMEFNLKNQNDDIAIVEVDTNYKVQQHKFSKSVVLHKENGEWKIYEYPSLYPVKVR